MASHPPPAPAGSDLVAERRAAFGRRRSAVGGGGAADRPEATFPAGPVLAATAIGGLVTYVMADAGAFADQSVLPPWLAATAVFLGIAGLVFVLIRLGAVDGRRSSNSGDSGSSWSDRDRCDADGDGGGGDGGGD